MSTLQEDLAETKRSKVIMEEEYRITIEKYVKEVREYHVKLTKVRRVFTKRITLWGCLIKSLTKKRQMIIKPGSHL